MIREPLVSVILPVYNGESFVAKTIESVLNQTYENMQIIIIDDASKDGSRDVIESFKDDRIETLFFEKNHNVCLGANVALTKARGEYIAVIGHDDIWAETKIEKQINVMEEDESIAFCSTDMDIIDEDDNLITPEWEEGMLVNARIYDNLSQEEALFWLLTSGNHVYAPSVVMRKSCLDKVGFYRNALIQTQDYDQWLRLLTVGRVYAINEKLIKYRRFSDNKTNISSVNTDTMSRQSHESNYSVYDVIKNMEDNLFVRTFKDYLRGNPNPANDKEVICEKACILADLKNPFFYSLYIEIADNEECRLYLEERCDFGLNKFYEYNKAPIINDSVYYDLCNRQMQLINELTGK